jgi:RNA polymerase sigma factor (sigma-70 family)
MRAASIPARRAPAGPLRSRHFLALAGDERLVEQVRRGNDVAFEIVFERHGPAILAFCRHMLGSPQEAEDAVQHTFAAAYRDLRMGGEREIALKPWLFTIARNRSVSMLRVRRDVPTGDAALESAAPAGAGLAEAVEERAELRRLLEDVRELPDEQRAALLLTEVGDLSHVEVAGVLDCEVSRVKGLVFRARSALIARREAREAPCERIREQLANLRGGALRRSELRLHLRECPGCRDYREQVRQQRQMLAVALPVAPTLGLKSSVLAAVGVGGGSAGGLTAAAGGLGGATVAKVAVAGVLAGGGIVAGDAVVNSDRPAVAPPGPSHAAPQRDGAAAEQPGAVSRGTGRLGRPAGAGGGVPHSESPGRAGERGRQGMGRERGRGPIAAPPQATPVRRGPAAKESKPWKAEPGPKGGPRGLAKGHAKPAPGSRAEAKPGPRANGHAKQAKPDSRTHGNGDPSANGGPPATGGPKANGRPPATGAPNANGGRTATGKPPPSRKTTGSTKPAGSGWPLRRMKTPGGKRPSGSTKPPAGTKPLAGPNAKADALAPGGKAPAEGLTPR